MATNDVKGSPRFEKLKSLLRELFQLDQPDLDFGIYRILHAKSGEVMQFLEKDLLPQIRDAFARYRTADKADLEKELTKVVAQAKELGVDPDSSPKVQELNARLKGDAVDIAGLEAEVYDHLYGFFRRYYDEGDFLSKRVYKPGVYAIPYEGEEVKLHWANHDQYYIKTSEYLRDYAFRLRPESTTEPMRVHFRLVDAAEEEHGNVKPAEGKERAFVLAPDGDPAAAFIAEEGGELIIRFEYRPATEDDWPLEERTGRNKAATRKDLIAIAVKRVLSVKDGKLARWLAELGKPHTKADGEKADYSRLEAHLRRYTARNTFDYFIHKDLRGFLRRELDFYVKNEVMRLDDVEDETVPRVEQYLSKIKVIRRIAHKLIDFLAQLEDFQKKLWLKKKFVVETQYCITLRCVPEELYPEIAANDAQREEWVRLFAIDEIKGNLHEPAYGVPLGVEFLKAHPSLVVDTRHFPAELSAKLLEAVEDVEELMDGVLVHGENFQALSLAKRRYSGRIACTYIDPPYNTGDDENFPYKDQYQHSTWLSMLLDRLEANRTMLSRDGVLVVSVGLEEHGALDAVLKLVFGASSKLGELVWEKGRKNDARRFSIGHDYLFVVARDPEELEHLSLPWREPKQGLAPVITEYHRLKAQHGRDFAAVSAGLESFYRSLPEGHPSKKFRRARYVDKRGIWRDNNISWPGGGGPRYDIPHPKTGKPCLVPKDGWRFVEATMTQKIEDDFVVFREDHTESPFLKSYVYVDGGLVEDDNGNGQPQVMGSVFYRHSQPSNDWMKDLFGAKPFANPKDHEILGRLVAYVSNRQATVLDYFAGSGSCAHAVIESNRSMSSARRFVSVEMGHHFDAVLLPRIKKVTFTPEWKDGKPKRMATAEEAERGPRIVKVIRLESYEDTLNNLAPRRTESQQKTLFAPEADGENGFREQYMLRYMLDVETRGNASLLNVAAFLDPTAYRLKVKRPGSDESREVNVDLLETFNWLIGLTVEHIGAPRTFTADTERDAEGRLRLKGRLREDPAGAWWFRSVKGTTPDGRKALVIWRNRPGGEIADGIARDNLVLDEWFTKLGYSTKDAELDLIYVNGDNNLENLKALDDTWKVRLIEEDFFRLMFDTEGV